MDEDEIFEMFFGKDVLQPTEYTAEVVLKKHGRVLNIHTTQEERARKYLQGRLDDEYKAYRMMFGTIENMSNTPKFSGIFPVMESGIFPVMELFEREED